MSRAALARVGLVLAGLGLGLLAAEGLARVVRPAGHADLLFDSPDASPRDLYVIDPELVLVPRPGFSDTIRSQGYTVPLAFDEAGVRIPPDQPEVASGGWVAAGDSFTLAVQVPVDQTFAARVGERLGVPVHNIGVDGYSTWQASRRAARVDRSRDTEGVLLTFFLGNDLQDNERFPHVLRTVEGREAGASIPRPEVALWETVLLRYSAIYAHIRVWRRARALRSGADPARQRWQEELAIFSEEGAGTLQRLLPSTRRALSEARQATQRRGDRLVVALAPPAFVVHPDRLASTFEVVGLDPARARPDAPRDAIARELASLGIETCDLTPALRAAADAGQALYFTYDGHWTAAGHAVVADAMATCLAEEPR
jgi:hypothetical protein